MDDNIRLDRKKPFTTLLSEYRQSSPQRQGQLLAALRMHPSYDSEHIWHELCEEEWPIGSEPGKKSLLVWLIQVESDGGPYLEFKHLVDIYCVAILCLGLEEADRFFCGGRNIVGLMPMALSDLSEEGRRSVLSETSRNLGHDEYLLFLRGLGIEPSSMGIYPEDRMLAKPVPPKFLNLAATVLGQAEAEDDNPNN